MEFKNQIQNLDQQKIEESEKIVNEQILNFGFEYVEKISSFKIKPIGHSAPMNDIKSLLLNHTEFSTYFFNEYKKRILGEVDELERKKFLKLQDEILEEIVQLRKVDRHNWIQEAQGLVKNRIELFGEVKNKKKEEINKENKIGVLHFFQENIDSDFKKRFPVLEKISNDLNLKENDSFLSVHFEEYYKNNNIKLNINTIENAFAQLASKIILDFKEIKFIFLKSWLVSRIEQADFMKDSGLKIYEKDFTVGKDNSFWGQFIDIHGKIKEKNISEFLETGVSQYPVSTGIITVNDFLKKYLPENKRGNITLLDLDYSFAKKVEEESLLINKLFESWDFVTDRDIDNFFSESLVSKKFLTTKEGKGFDALLKYFKKSNKKIYEVKSDLEFLSYIKLLEFFVKENKFISKEVKI